MAQVSKINPISIITKLRGVAQSIIAKIENETSHPRASTLRKIVQSLSRTESPDKLHTVSDVMITDVAALEYDDKIQQAIDNMVKYGISQLPVLSKEGSILGMISEESILQKDAHRNSLVGEVMSPNPAIVGIDLSIAEARKTNRSRDAFSSRKWFVTWISRMDLVHALRLNSIA